MITEKVFKFSKECARDLLQVQTDLDMMESGHMDDEAFNEHLQAIDGMQERVKNMIIGWSNEESRAAVRLIACLNAIAFIRLNDNKDTYDAVIVDIKRRLANKERVVIDSHAIPDVTETELSLALSLLTGYL